MRLIDADQAIELIRGGWSRKYRRKEGTIQDSLKILSSEFYSPTVELDGYQEGRVDALKSISDLIFDYLRNDEQSAITCLNAIRNYINEQIKEQKNETN